MAGWNFPLPLLQLALFFSLCSATVFKLHNRCSHTIWPATHSGDGGVVIADGGFALPPGGSIQFEAPAGWSGRFWARTGCFFDAAGNGHCTTGDCAGKLKCVASGEPPVTLAEFSLAAAKDFYDVSVVDGFNVGVGVQPTGGSGDCRHPACAGDVIGSCPKELQVVGGGGVVVACRSACVAFHTPEYCCNGDHSSPETCGPTAYSLIFKGLCPSAYSYAYDDRSSTFTCSGADYTITFCPN